MQVDFEWGARKVGFVAHEVGGGDGNGVITSGEALRCGDRVACCIFAAGADGDGPKALGIGGGGVGDAGDGDVYCDVGLCLAADFGCGVFGEQVGGAAGGAVEQACACGVAGAVERGSDDQLHDEGGAGFCGAVARCVCDGDLRDVAHAAGVAGQCVGSWDLQGPGAVVIHNDAGFTACGGWRCAGVGDAIDLNRYHAAGLAGAAEHGGGVFGEGGDAVCGCACLACHGGVEPAADAVQRGLAGVDDQVLQLDGFGGVAGQVGLGGCDGVGFAVF